MTIIHNNSAEWARLGILIITTLVAMAVACWQAVRAQQMAALAEERDERNAALAAVNARLETALMEQNGRVVAMAGALEQAALPARVAAEMVRLGLRQRKGSNE